MHAEGPQNLENTVCLRFASERTKGYPKQKDGSKLRRWKVLTVFSSWIPRTKKISVKQSPPKSHYFF